MTTELAARCIALCKVWAPILDARFKPPVAGASDDGHLSLNWRARAEGSREVFSADILTTGVIELFHRAAADDTDLWGMDFVLVKETSST